MAPSGDDLGIHVPDGDPAQLEGAANALRNVAFNLNHVAGRLRAASQVPGWTGIASFTFADACTTDVHGVHRGADTMLAGARVVDRLAHDLREAQRAARAAVHAAQDADARRRTAETAAEHARDEATRQRIIADAAQMRVTQRQILGDPAADDIEAHRLATDAAARADQEADHHDDDRRHALRELADARHAAQRANHRYQRLARAAARAIEGAAADTPTMVHPSVPAGRRGNGIAPGMIPAFALRQGAPSEGEAEGEEQEAVITWGPNATTQTADAADGAERAATAAAARLARLASAEEPEVAAAAERALPATERTAETVGRLARPLGILAPAVVLTTHRMEGEGWASSIVRTGLATAGAAAGATGAGTACGAVTFGLAAAACGAVGGAAGGYLGEKVGDLIFGD